MAHLLVVVSRRYNRHEFWDALKVVKRRGHTFEVVSSTLVIRDERRRGHSNALSKTIDNIHSMDGYDGIVVISGNPEDTEYFWHHKGCQSLVQEASDKGLTIAALCSAVPSIRNAANGKLVSVYPLFKSIDLLESHGAIINKASLSTDGKLVTAENEVMTTMWITNVCDVLEGKPPSYIMSPSPFKRKRHLMKNDPVADHIIKVMRKTGRSGLK